MRRSAGISRLSASNGRSAEASVALLPGVQEFDPSMPLIGVGLLSEKDQTFSFSKEAIDRILMEHDRLFSRIEWLRTA